MKFLVTLNFNYVFLDVWPYKKSVHTYGCVHICEVIFLFFLTNCQINFSQRVKFVKRLFKHCAHVFIRYHLHDIKSLQIQILMLSKKKIKPASVERLSLMMFARGVGIIKRIWPPLLTLGIWPLLQRHQMKLKTKQNDTENWRIELKPCVLYEKKTTTTKNAEILMNYQNLLWPSGLFILLDSIHFYQFRILVN